MTQRYIRRYAGFGLAKRVYMGLLEPRVVTAIHGVAYVILTVAGILSLIFLPEKVADSGGGQLLASMIAVFLVTGGGGGVVTILRGDQWAERFAVWALIVGVTAYWLTVGIAALLLPGAQFMGVVGWTLTLILLILRLHWILDKPHRPGSRSDDQSKRRQYRRNTSHH